MQDPAERVVPAPQDFARILWLHRGPARDAATFAAIRKLGFGHVHVSGAGRPAEEFGAASLGYYHDQLLGKGELELRQRTWEEMREGFLADRQGARPKRPACLSDLGVLERLSTRLAARLRGSLPHGPLCVSLADEPSVTRHANPLDLCFGPACLRRYRTFLKQRYGKVGELNAAFGTDFKSFAEVLPMPTDEIRARELRGGQLPRNLAPWAAHREFMDARWAGLIQRLCAQVGSLAPGLPVGLTGLQQPSAFGGHNYHLQMRGQSFYEVYDIGGSRDLAMCTAPRGAWQMATLFPLRGDEPVELCRARVADMLAHGMAGVITWSLGDILDDERQATRFGQATQQAFAALQPAMRAFAGAELQRDPVWMLESQASVRAWWMWDSREDAETWVNRLSSYEKRHSTSLAARESWLRILEDLGMQPRVVPVPRLGAALQRAATAGAVPRLIVLPATLALSDASARLLRAFVERGGVLLADHSLGFYDERLRLRETPVLDEFFGLQGRRLQPRDQLVLQGRGQPAGRLRNGVAAAERGLGAEIAEQRAGFAVQLEQERGKGRCYYLNLALCEYASLRLDGKRLRAALELRKRVRHVLREAGLNPPVELRAQQMPTCLERMRLIGRGDANLLAIRVNALAQPELLEALAERHGNKPVELHLRFPKPVKLHDLLRGRGSRGKARTYHRLPLDIWSGLFLRVEAGG